VQNASNEQLQAVQNTNLDRHSGSAGGGAPESIQIFMGDGPIGTWNDEKETSLDVRIPKEAGAQGIADVILEHLRQRTDLPGLSI